IMPIPMVLALEAECQQAPVTEVMANVNGRRLTDPEEDRIAAACFLATYSEKRRQGAVVDTEVAIAMSDGKLSPSELQRLRREAGKERDAISEFCAVLDGAIATGGAKATLKIVASGD
ncbi:MAG TPA: hypothetical protein VGN93_30860, partial [Shinella sp.]|uniref:hypothetical protein n=1 Tax=Shinella sp. TaxID=1870904 RepID=UPI002E0E587A|nr:hypothetical protein [Shinella sp.]